MCPHAGTALSVMNLDQASFWLGPLLAALADACLSSFVLNSCKPATSALGSMLRQSPHAMRALTIEPHSCQDLPKHPEICSREGHVLSTTVYLKWTAARGTPDSSTQLEHHASGSAVHDIFAVLLMKA